jgi:hypothetical protein
LKENSKRINEGGNAKLKYNLDLPEPEKSYWGGQLTGFHRKPMNRVYKMIEVLKKYQEN